MMMMLMVMMMMMMMSYHNGGGVYDVRPFIFCLPNIQFACVCQTRKRQQMNTKKLPFAPKHYSLASDDFFKCNF